MASAACPHSPNSSRGPSHRIPHIWIFSGWRCHTLLPVHRGRVAVSGDALGCHHRCQCCHLEGHSRCTGQPPTTEDHLAPGVHGARPGTPARPRKETNGHHLGVLPILFLDFPRLSCFLLETCQLHMCAGEQGSAQPNHTDPKCRPPSPLRPASHGPASGLGAHLSPPHHGPVVPQGPRLVQRRCSQNG